MRTVHSLLAIYGEFDRLVIEAGADSETADIVERYLPGTRGNAGWFDEIRRFLAIPPGTMEEFPSAAVAITELVREQEELEEAGDDAKPLTKSQLSRLAFAIGVLSRLPDTEPRLTDDTLRSGLALTVNAEITDKDDAAGQLLDKLRAEFRHRDDWPAVMMSASGLIDPTVGRMPLCRARLRQAHGQTCVVLTTKFTSDQASLDELKNVVDPLNWHHCLPFFCDMQAQGAPTRADKWSRVLEITSTTCKVPNTPVMKTPLKYWKGPRKAEQAQEVPLQAWVNYELDDTPGAAALGDGLVLVDEGFIRMESTTGDAATKGVRVATKKVVCFRYLSEVAIAILACVAGYGEQGLDMLVDGVEKRKATSKSLYWTDWSPSEPPPDTADAPGSSAPTDISVPSDAKRPSRRAILLAVDMANECIDDFTKKSTSVANKMATGTMPVPEMITLYTEFAARLATDPWRYLERLRAQQRSDT
jgi:hypothetical protein